MLTHNRHHIEHKIQNLHPISVARSYLNRGTTFHITEKSASGEIALEEVLSSTNTFRSSSVISSPFRSRVLRVTWGHRSDVKSLVPRVTWGHRSDVKSLVLRVSNPHTTHLRSQVRSRVLRVTWGHRSDVRSLVLRVSNSHTTHLRPQVRLLVLRVA